MFNSDDDIPYRTHVDTSPAQQVSSTDEQDYSTLQNTRDELAAAIAGLDKWHAFDLEKTAVLTLKQQIVAHRIAYDILSPLLEGMNNSIALIDQKFKGV